LPKQFGLEKAMAQIVETPCVLGNATALSTEEHPVEYYLHERYNQPRKERRLLKAYYALRPLLPRSLQLAIRRQYAKKQAQVKFPAWPIEPILIYRANREMKARIEQSEEKRIPIINFWPRSFRAAVTLTHDVEGDVGLRNIPRVRELEEKYGVVSSWNFVPERYPFDKKVFKELTDQGCEIGLHGLHHDGKDVLSRKIFEQRLPTMNRYLKQWGAVGFRSPATHRNPDWMPELAAEYGSSFPDTDPFEPQSGGCCSVFPFFLGEMVELPITLVQDHTLIEILQKKDIDVWTQKSRWIIENHGLINIITHPDYMLTEKNLQYYDQFLAFIMSQENLWHALPNDVARWWRDRSKSEVITMDDLHPIIKGPASDRGSITWAELDGGEVKYSTISRCNET
jgi:peptidoglycan/xylan/chitin deacetylase (PgdA/CDA1 family)